MLTIKKKKLLKIKYKRLFSCKFKIKYLILKSLYFNRNQLTSNRSVINLIIKQKKYINNRYFNSCRFSWYNKSVNKFTGFGRHELNRRAILGELQNISINSW